MKLTLTLVLAVLLSHSSFSQVNGVYAQDGKTIEVDKTVHEIVTTTTPEILYFSNGAIIKLDTNSDLLINNFYQDVETNPSPEVLKVDVSNFEATLNKGDAWVIYNGSTNENSSCIISTPLADHELAKGSYYFQINSDRDIVVSMDGSSKTTENGSMALAVKSYATVVKQEDNTGILSSKESMYVDNVKASELQKLTNETKDMTAKFIFIRIDGKTVAVLL